MGNKELDAGRVPSGPGCEASPSAADGVFAESHPSREAMAERTAIADFLRDLSLQAKSRIYGNGLLRQTGTKTRYAEAFLTASALVRAGVHAPRDTDGSPKGTDAQQPDGEAATAGAGAQAKASPDD